ncbi:MAG: glycosyltransferase family 4 protein [Kiritimatiellae bacterium]|nr:glycosyltransferase family 4 protein [Kiritimatiellia bacterium]
MIIVIDARWIFEKVSGIGAYTQELLRELPGLDANNQYIALFDNPDLAVRTEKETGINHADNVRVQLVPYSVFSIRNQCLLPSLLRSLKADVFHSPNYMIPMLPRRRQPGQPVYITTVHDVIPLKFPDHAPKSKKTRLMPIFKRLMQRVATASDAVITVSQQSKADIHEFLHVPPEQQHKVHVVYNGVSHYFSPLEEKSAPPNAERHLLYVGRADPYKNVPLLVRVADELTRRCPFPVRLILAGPPDDRYPQAIELAKELGIEDRVGWTGYLSHEALAQLYRESDVLVHPSRYEGFGLQILEAMASGLPVVCSNGGSLPEVAGEAARIVDPDDVTGYVNTIVEVLTTPALSADLRKRGSEQAARFSWHKSATETLKIYTETGQRIKKHEH